MIFKIYISSFFSLISPLCGDVTAFHVLRLCLHKQMRCCIKSSTLCYIKHQCYSFYGCNVTGCLLCQDILCTSYCVNSVFFQVVQLDLAGRFSGSPVRLASGVDIPFWHDCPLAEIWPRLWAPPAVTQQPFISWTDTAVVGFRPWPCPTRPPDRFPAGSVRADAGGLHLGLRQQRLWWRRRVEGVRVDYEARRHRCHGDLRALPGNGEFCWLDLIRLSYLHTKNKIHHVTNNDNSRIKNH